MKPKFRRNKFGKMTMCNLQTRLRFQKELLERVDELTDQFPSKEGQQCKF